MRQLTTWLAWIAPVLALAPLGLAHCSGDSSTVGGDAGKKGSGSSSGSGSSGGNGSSGGDDSSSVGPETDGGTAPVGDGSIPTNGEGGADGSSTPPGIPVPEGGAPSDPGSVMCNGTPCNVSMGFTCCYARSDAGPTEKCNPPNTGCATETIACNEASDCNGGLCCQSIIGIGLQGSTSCSAPMAKACPAQTFQTCRTDGECGASSDAGALKRCIPQVCTSPMAGPMTAVNTVTIQACAAATTAQNDAGTLAFCKPL